MIIVTRLHGPSLAVNCDLIERVEATPVPGPRPRPGGLGRPQGVGGGEVTVELRR